MNFQGKDAISRPTRTTGRGVLLLSFLLGLAGLGWIEIADNTLLGLSVKEDKFLPLLKLLCGLSVVAHLVQWFSDYISYRGWNVTGKMPGGSRFSAPSETKLQDCVDGLADLLEKNREDQCLSSRLEKLEEQVKELRWDMRSFDIFSKFYVFGWHLCVPLGAAIVAFVVERHA
ncbi:hypothetical protein [Mameliella sp.]|uniref:hypothetical protein n=1 Tax=Mameliella sp. TaxID=1924940 RepID=UPI003BACA044